MRPRHVVSLLCAVILLAMIGERVWSSPSSTHVNKIVEYRTLQMPFPPPPRLLQEKLTEYENEGWELVTIIPSAGILIFKQT